METAVLLKRSVTGAGIFRIIGSEFSHRKEPGPIVLFIIDESLEIGLHRAVLPLDLAINLVVKSSGESLLDCKKVV